MSILTVTPEQLLKLVVTRAGLPKLMVTADEAAEILSLSRSTVYELMEAGRLPSVLIGRARRVSWAALETFVASLDPAPVGPLTSNADR
jgi:excisionase family DNA binding protein